MVSRHRHDVQNIELCGQTEIEINLSSRSGRHGCWQGHGDGRIIRFPTAVRFGERPQVRLGDAPAAHRSAILRGSAVAGRGHDAGSHWLAAYRARLAEPRDDTPSRRRATSSDTGRNARGCRRRIRRRSAETASSSRSAIDASATGSLSSLVLAAATYVCGLAERADFGNLGHHDVCTPRRTEGSLSQAEPEDEYRRRTHARTHARASDSLVLTASNPGAGRKPAHSSSPKMTMPLARAWCPGCGLIIRPGHYGHSAEV